MKNTYNSYTEEHDRLYRGLSDLIRSLWLESTTTEAVVIDSSSSQKQVPVWVYTWSVLLTFIFPVNQHLYELAFFNFTENFAVE